jgi:hypothetical protein
MREYSRRNNHAVKDVARQVVDRALSVEQLRHP